MNSFKSLLFLAFALSLTIACKKSGEDANASLAATSTEAVDPASTTPAEDVVPVGPLTTISFPESEFDFGEIQDGEKITHTFKFTNTGSEPLVISKAVGSCGCTVPDWPKEPIAPGKTGEIKVQYDSRGKGATKAEGGRIENKRVTITANTDPVNTYVHIKGKVFKDADAPAN